MRPGIIRPRGQLVAWIGLMLFVGAHHGLAADKPPLGRFDLAPYEVAISVTFAPDPVIDMPFRRNVIESLRSRIDQTFGAAWSVRSGGGGITDNEDLSPAN